MNLEGLHLNSHDEFCRCCRTTTDLKNACIPSECAHTEAMASFTAETQRLLQNAYTAGVGTIANDRETAHVPAESFGAITKVEQHRWHWRPDRPRLILIAESHVYTSAADLGVTINQGEVAPFIPTGQPLPPSNYVGLVYCLGYGETNLLLNRHANFSNRGTWQFWDLFGRVAGTGKQPRASAGTSLRARLEWKIQTLIRLKEIGVWLLDASAHAIYIGDRLRRSQKCCQALHRQWWEHYGRQVISECDDPVVWVIGSSAHGHLADLDQFSCQDFIYQPNARGKIDKERNWDRLMAEVAVLRQNPVTASA
jgi:hypothetical protein